MGVVPMQAPSVRAGCPRRVSAQSVRAEESASLRIVTNALAIGVARLAWADTAARVS